MKKWLLHIWCIGVLGMLAASCSQIIDDPINEGNCGLETEEVKVTFTIAMGNPDSGSRADISSNDPWSNYDDEENGNGTMGNRYFDNKIEPEKLQVLICKEDCTPIVEVEKLLYTQTATNIYTFTGAFEATISPADKYKIMVFANCPDVNVESTWTDYLPMEIGNQTANLTSIPMWGVKTISGAAFAPGTNTDIGTIFVLRAMAKVEIELDEAIADEYSLTGAKFNSYNKYVNCIPKGYNGYTYNNGTENVVVNVEKTEDLRTISTFNPNSTTSGTELAFMTVIENRHLVAYVPEYDNDGSLKMIVNLKKGTQDEKDYDILFNDLGATTTTPFDVIRNHYYKYTITAVEDNSGMELTLAVTEWTDVETELEYSNELSYDDGSWSNLAGTIGTDYKVPLKTVSSADATDKVTALYSFSINTPQTIEWMAVLEDPQGKFQFDMNQTSGKGTVEGTNAIQRTVKGELLVTGSDLKLGVKAINPSESGQYEATLRVYVTYGGKTIELDLTDGDVSTLNHFTILHSKL